MSSRVGQVFPDGCPGAAAAAGVKVGEVVAAVGGSAVLGFGTRGVGLALDHCTRASAAAAAAAAAAADSGAQTVELTLWTARGLLAEGDDGVALEAAAARSVESEVQVPAGAEAGCAAEDGQRQQGAAAVASFLAAVLTEIYLCDVCSGQEILRRNGRAQDARQQESTQPPRRWDRSSPCSQALPP
jgi:hypothetical protein